MDLPAFEDLLDRHGAAPERWPPGDRRAAEALLATSPAARALAATMRQVEAALRAPAPVRAATDVAAVAMRHRQDRPVRPWLRNTGWGAVAAATLAAGVLVGSLHLDAMRDGPDRIVASALDAGNTGDDDVD